MQAAAAAAAAATTGTQISAATSGQIFGRESTPGDHLLAPPVRPTVTLHVACPYDFKHLVSIFFSDHWLSLIIFSTIRAN